MNFTKEELIYIKNQILLSKKSLDDCCENRIPFVTYISKDDAKEEYKLLDSILNKLGDI